MKPAHMACVLGIVGFALLAGIVPAWWLGRRYRERWGIRHVPAGPVGSGPYRQVQVATPQLRGTPWVVRVAAALGIAWAILTVVVMVPSGVFVLLGLTRSGLAAAVGIPGVLALMLDGVALCVPLCTSGVELLRVEGYPPPLEGLVRWTAIHHGGRWG